jgi:hypothetical protein
MLHALLLLDPVIRVHLSPLSSQLKRCGVAEGVIYRRLWHRRVRDPTDKHLHCCLARALAPTTGIAAWKTLPPGLLRTIFDHSIGAECPAPPAIANKILGEGKAGCSDMGAELNDLRAGAPSGLGAECQAIHHTVL